ncbi:MAG: rod shape-determining protein MreD [Elusimicrobia bacterium]|nr:rod shape-determining protein MreD [Elusimicrobiota bacterium]
MNILRGTVLFFVAMFVQWWWNSHLSYWGAAPQFLLTLTVLVAARRGPVAAMLVGYVWGLYSDTLRADLFGANALLYALAGYAAGAVRRQMDLRAVGPLVATVFLLSWAYALLLGVLGQIFLHSFWWVGWISFLATPFLNAAFAVVGALAWEFWGDN